MPKVELVSGDHIAPLGSGTAGGSPLDFDGSRGLFEYNSNPDLLITDLLRILTKTFTEIEYRVLLCFDRSGRLLNTALVFINH